MFGYIYKDEKGRIDGRSCLLWHTPEAAIEQGEKDMCQYKKENNYTTEAWGRK